MKRHASLLWFGVLAAQASCIARTHNDSRPTLVGGREAYEGELPAAVMLEHEGRAHCSMTKVGLRHFLTAAHCVVDKEPAALRARFRPGQSIVVRHGILHSEMARHELTVYETRVMQEYLSHAGDTELNSDLALVVVNEETPSIGLATIANEKPMPGQKIYLSGFGCEDLADNGGERRLKIGLTEVSELTDWRIVVGAWTTNGEHVEGCKGDSGGAAWLLKDGEMRLAGVNSSLRPEVATFVTRIDSGAPNGIARWLASSLKVKGDVATQPAWTLTCSGVLGPVPAVVVKHTLVSLPQEIALTEGPRNWTLKEDAPLSYTSNRAGQEQMRLQIGNDTMVKAWTERCPPDGTCQREREIALERCTLTSAPARLVPLEQTMVSVRPVENSAPEERCRLREGEELLAISVEQAPPPFLKVRLATPPPRCNLTGELHVRAADFELFAR